MCDNGDLCKRNDNKLLFFGITSHWIMFYFSCGLWKNQNLLLLSSWSQVIEVCSNHFIGEQTLHESPLSIKSSVFAQHIE